MVDELIVTESELSSTRIVSLLVDVDSCSFKGDKLVEYAGGGLSAAGAFSLLIDAEFIISV